MKSNKNRRMFDAFCKKVLRNEARDCYRQIKHRREKEILLSELPDSILSQIESWDDDITQHYVFVACDELVIIKNGWIGQYLEELPQQQRQIILLSYYVGYSDREIGKMFGLPKSTVQYRRNATLLELKEKMEESGYGFFIDK